jgi:hypothetical protein
MAKQPPWAAAMSSSGLVPDNPSSFLNLVVNEYGVLFNTPLVEVSVPLPSRPFPCQMAVAFLFMIFIFLGFYSPLLWD